MKLDLTPYSLEELILFAGVAQDASGRVVAHKKDVVYNYETGRYDAAFFTCDLLQGSELARKDLSPNQRDSLFQLWKKFAGKRIFYNYMFLDEVNRTFEVWKEHSKYKDLGEFSDEVKQAIKEHREKALKEFAKLLRRAANAM